MPFGQLVIGAPGAGKTTYCNGIQQFMRALNRPAVLVNLDPAALELPYDADIDVRDFITVREAQPRCGLGPNGALLYCIEYLEANSSWLVDKLNESLSRNENSMFVFDTSGQSELTTNHDALRNLIDVLYKQQWRLMAVHLVDSWHITDPSRYISMLLLSLRSMLHMGMPQLNILSKVDLLADADLAFNLDYYTEVQDLSHLVDLMETQNPLLAKFSRLNELICELIEENALVEFTTLAVEDRDSMYRLVKNIDRILGYVLPASAEHIESSMGSHDHQHQHHHHHHHFDLPLETPNSLAGAVQEKYIDHPRLYREFERELWEKEGDEIIAKANEESLAQARMNSGK